MPVAASLELACDAAFCWDLLADPCLAPEWVTGVADAVLLEADPAGRPRRVRFTGMPSSASLVYEMSYAYDEAARRLQWTTVGDGERSLAGEASIEDLGAGRCRVHYALTSSAARSVPAWARDTLAGDTPARVVALFQQFVERRAAAAAAVR